MRCLILILLLVWSVVLGENSDSLRTEWLFQNTYETDQIYINEAIAVLPDELTGAIEYYQQGSYRRAADVLVQIRNLNLPDGSLPYISFMLGECYRMLDLKSKALEEYFFTATFYHESDIVPPSLYRILEYKADEGIIEVADSIKTIFSKAYKKHPLYHSVLYRCGKLYFDLERFDEALIVLSEVSPSSKRYYQSRFLFALCHVQLQQWDKALLALNNIYKKAADIEMKTEALIVMGDIHYRNNRVDKAMGCFSKVDKKATRYEYALVKVSRCLLDQGFYEKAVATSKKFCDANTTSDYYFEMASILEQAYENMGKKDDAAAVGNSIHRQIVSARIAFELFDEIDRLTDINKQFQIAEYYALAKDDTIKAVRATNARSRGEVLKKKLRLLLREVDRPDLGTEIANAPRLAERRYLSMLKKNMQRLEDSITTTRRARVKALEAGKNNPADSLLLVKISSLDSILLKNEQRFRETSHEHELIIAECLGGNAEEKRVSEDMQVKFIDWEFMRYIDKKEKMVEMLKQIRNTENAGSMAPAAHPETHGAPSDSQLQNEIKLLERSIVDERERLANHVETMLDIFPRSRYASATLFRLAELYFDRAGDIYRDKLAAYEKKLLENKDSLSIIFPEYDLRDALTAYRTIYQKFPHDRYADNAMYYGALALKKQGMDEPSQKMLVDMIEKYPQSEFYVEANMNIGRYYFEHAKEFTNGYKRAEESFRKVLFYRDHPQFVQALYHLGWCYYMQDQFDKAIAAFRYMIEEVDLEFDPFAKEDKDVANPLLRTEAIDYLAISFDQDRKFDDALEFFKLIGNDDYAALVMNRMGELREEDIDFEGAVTTYKQLLSTYPLSLSAPEAMVRLIKLYKNANDLRGADGACDEFIKNYSTGSDWQKRIGDRDSSLIVRVDSMVIAIGLTIADNAYRAAEITGSQEAYLAAARNYQRIVERYPVHPGAADAAWNHAALLNDKLGDKPAAYERFVALSKYPGVDSVKRENAALNAIAIAQSLLPEDTTGRKGVLDFASDKLVAAVKNYTDLFSGGASTSKVLFTMAGVYYNRGIYAKAAEIYQKIIESKPVSEFRYEAMLLLGQCAFGEEKWNDAAGLFENVGKSDAPSEIKSKAYTLMLQSLFFHARVLAEKGMHEDAADAFAKLDDKYPGSQYGDIALYNAAESHEQNGQYIRACDRYYDLVKRYPQSKLAADALFNAAGNFEKAEKYSRAAETYETIVAQYASHAKAKDALFNLGFCYEKLGKLDEMTAANERYSMLYPEEKDVEALLIRSALYYVKTGMFDKAVTLFKNFIRRFPYSQRSVEAYFHIGKCQYDQNDRVNALLSFQQTEQHNARMLESNNTPNNYYAAEAALYHGLILNDQFEAIKLKLPEATRKLLLKEKFDILTLAVADFQRVMQYKSEKMFEAGYRMGEMYEKLTDAIVNQEKSESDPIRAAVMENDFLTTASKVLQNAFLPYRKIIELSKEIDSLSTQQKEWVDKARKNICTDILLAGTYMYEGVGAMQKAPVPKEIQSDPLLYFQYKIKLLETLEPMKKSVLAYFIGIHDSLGSFSLDDSLAILTEINIARLTFLISSSYDKLAQEILASTKDLPKNLSETEKEDLLFQLEDIVFELQDKALLQLEDARNDLINRKLENSDWFAKITASLARLSPEKYGSTFFRSSQFITDSSWICRGDSIEQWNKPGVTLSGWRRVVSLSSSRIDKMQKPGTARFIGGDTLWKKVYLWKNAFVNGRPQSARIAVKASGRYRLYLNGVLTMSDTTGNSDKLTLDSLNSVETLLKGGDNIISCEVLTDSVPSGAAILLLVMADTTETFTSELKTPPVSGGGRSSAVADVQVENAKSSNKNDRSGDGAGNTTTITRQQLLAEIAKYQERERVALAELRKERLEIQKLRIKKAHKDKNVSQESNRSSLVQPPAEIPASAPPQ